MTELSYQNSCGLTPTQRWGSRKTNQTSSIWKLTPGCSAGVAVFSVHLSDGSSSSVTVISYANTQREANWQMTSSLTCFWGSSTCGCWNSTSRSLSAPASLLTPQTGTCSSGRPWPSDCVWGRGRGPAGSHSAGTKSGCLWGTETLPVEMWQSEYSLSVFDDVLSWSVYLPNHDHV